MAREGRAATSDSYDIAVDFMDITDDRRLWVRAIDAVSDFEPAVGEHVIVGDDDADRKVARVVSIDADANLELELLPGPLEAHRDVVVRA